ncbi:MAG: hypothetical protein ACOC0F_03420, partial [archaeon]
MTVPQHPDKHEASALITPGVSREHHGNGDGATVLPSSVVVTFQPHLFDHAVREHAREAFD